MKLVAITAEHLRPGDPLPFALRDENGRLLLAAGIATDAEMFAELAGQSLWAEQSDAMAWQRRIAAAGDARIRQGASLGVVAAARPEALREGTASARVLSLAEDWDEIVLQLDAALRDLRPGSDALERVQALAARARALAERRPDASLYHLVYEAGQSTPKYSAHHAMLAMLMCEHSARALGLADAEVDALVMAALTMNVSITRLQDQMAATDREINAEVRAALDAHAAAGAERLRAAGLGDALAIEVVRQHHDADTGAPLATLAPAARLARLLRRVDKFTSKISRRATLPPVSPVLAAREACLGPDGKPDEVGGALLRSVGLYPPGSFVALVNGEMGIVLARGRRANLPYVASLVSVSGNVLAEPALRDTIDSRYAVKAALAPGAVKVRPPHERLLAMR